VQVKTVLHIIFISTILIWAAAPTSGGNAVMLFDCEGIDELAHRGITAPESAKYSVWAWARGGSSFRIRIGDAQLGIENLGSYRPYAWGKIGEVELKAKQTYAFQLDVQKPEDKVRQQTIGWLAISAAPGFNPQRTFELAHVYADRPGPVPDERVREKRHTRSPFEFPEYRTKQEWEARRAEIRRKILVSAGLWPMPGKCPLNVKVVDEIDRDGYTIEKLHIETLPGVYFPGALYRPKGRTGQFPAIINPHGHGKLGRMSGAVQIRCANFALQGYIAFSYNMIGFIDNDQMEHNFQSDPAYLWSVSVGGLQLWNSIRALDFITSLPEVDTDRVACTGCSGGGSQTFLVTAVDDRVKTAAPVCMVSSFFQGGCICENAPGLRLDTYNVEIAACAAPRPQILVAATGDWTDLTPEVEYPDVLNIYRLFGEQDKLTYYYQDAGHNYNQNSREAVYKWFGKWLLRVEHAASLFNKEDAEKLREVEVPVEAVETLRVFDDNHPMPDDALDQDALVQSIIAQAKEMLDNLWPRNEADLAEFRETMRPALADVLDVEYPGDVHAKIMPCQDVGRTKREKYTATRYILSRPSADDQIPSVLYAPKDGAEKKTANLVVHPEGKAALVYYARGEPCGLVEKMLEKDQMVLAIDTFLTGDHHSPFKTTQRERYCRYFTTFNPTDESLRVQDISTAIAYLQGREDVVDVNLIGIGEAGLWCLLANAFAPDLNRTAVDVVGFNNRDESAWVQHLNIPGILRVGGFDTAIACAAPRQLLIHNTAGTFDTERVKKLYEILVAGDNLRVDTEQHSDQDVLDWLME
jgi:dienelactone hydrolase